MQRVVPIVGPRGVHPEAAELGRPHEAGVVEVAFRHQEQGPADRGSQDVDLVGQLFEDVARGLIEDGVHRVETEPVAVVIPQPHQGVVEHEAAHLEAARPVEVHRRTPVGLVALGEIRPVLGEIVTGRSQVVVDHVQDDSEARQRGRRRRRL